MRYDRMYDCTVDDWHELLLMDVEPHLADLQGVDWIMDRFARLFGRHM